MFSSRKSSCCCWEGAVVFVGSNKSHRIPCSDESLLSCAIPAFPGHRPHGTVTTKIMCLVHILLQLCLLCSASSYSLPSCFCWMDFLLLPPASIHLLPISLSLSLPWKSKAQLCLQNLVAEQLFLSQSLTSAMNF